VVDAGPREGEEEGPEEAREVRRGRPMAESIFAYFFVINGFYCIAVGVWWNQGRAIDERFFGGFRRWLSRRSEAHLMMYRFGIWMSRRSWYRVLVFTTGIASICSGIMLLA
jgi:hypothetical protein